MIIIINIIINTKSSHLSVNHMQLKYHSTLLSRTKCKLYYPIEST